MWEDIFSTPFFNELLVEQCPMLVGITRLFEYRIKEEIASEYRFETLMKGNILARTQAITNRDILINELAVFKERCDENEQDLVSALSCSSFNRKDWF